jgi:hypothetical protein
MLSPYIEQIIGDHQCGLRYNLSTIDYIFLHSSNTGEKIGYNARVHHLFKHFKKSYDSVRREVLYNILIEFRIPMEIVRLIKMCLKEMYSKVRTGKHLFYNFPSRMGQNMEMLYHHCFSTLL